MCVYVAEVQCRQASLVQLQEEVEQQRAQMEQMELDKDSQLISLREELLSQTQQLDSCQARVSTYTHSQKRTYMLLYGTYSLNAAITISKLFGILNPTKCTLPRNQQVTSLSSQLIIDHHS